MTDEKLEIKRFFVSALIVTTMFGPAFSNKSYASTDKLESSICYDEINSSSDVAGLVLFYCEQGMKGRPIFCFGAGGQLKLKCI